jgi:methyl-accepting chemotaxis protein
MVKCLTVARRLTLRFGAVVVLLLAVSVISVLRLATAHQAATYVTDEVYPRSDAGRSREKKAALNNGRFVRSLLLTNSAADADKFLQQLEQFRSANTETMKKLATLLSTAEGKAKLQIASDRRDALAPMYERLHALSGTDRA